MSAYKDAFVIDADSSDERVSVAAELLRDGEAVVMLCDMLALRSIGNELLCEVIDPTPHAHRCVNEYEVLVENAQRLFATSDLLPLLPQRRRTWRVVEDYGTGVAELWRAP